MKTNFILLLATIALLINFKIAAAQIPVPDHIVIVVMENHKGSDIIGSVNAPFINSLASGGALFTQSYGVTHPSQPNYLHLFLAPIKVLLTMRFQKTLLTAPQILALLCWLKV